MEADSRCDTRSKLKRKLIRFVANVATLTVIGLAAGFAFLIYEVVRKSRLDGFTVASARMARVAMNSITNMDPIAVIFIFSLIGAVVVIGGMFIWRHFNR